MNNRINSRLKRHMKWGNIYPKSENALKILGTSSKPVGAMDSDGDKVPNMLDCKPYDKKKQGWIHDKIEEYKQKARERKAERSAIRSLADRARKEEREKQEVRIAREGEKMRADRRIKQMRSGTLGFFSGFMQEQSKSKSNPFNKPSKSKKSKSYRDYGEPASFDLTRMPRIPI